MFFIISLGILAAAYMVHRAEVAEGSQEPMNVPFARWEF